MGKTKWNAPETKPKRSGVYRVRQKAVSLWDESSGGIMEGFAWFEASLKRWSCIRHTVADARNFRDTCGAHYRAGQEKEWARV